MSLTEAERTILYMPWRCSFPAIPAPGTLTCSQLCTAVHKGFQGGGLPGATGSRACQHGRCPIGAERAACIYPIGVLTHCLLVMVTLQFPEIFQATIHPAWDKSVSIMSCVLTEK
ncbi:unnamed protein product [Nyctereutes procyonoides]|uniref:(raccoon dog) hypothetical protein n=1 Tax=Nyctereutes procyonoides TaxID=34880 RepID=A0A811ZXQ0_NYCPR|nr:unnamed protein product [Nyctereutes procyonoides]